ncbi:MFS transporter [Parasediminibacterium paludis]|uniref:MFS transporter n=1 Tax=Parasediminibacterium paludis TaxID=908966 RepID=A0ABV8PSW4_9BACT
MTKKEYGILSLPVIVGSLGFFVDIYDLLLFNIVRKKSLAELHVPDALAKEFGESVVSWQMLGLVVGGILWGMLGDKKGRKSVLFGSILLYSAATVANGFVQNVEQYTILRFVAALGLAGELGASITLVSEMLPKDKRGIGNSIIATSGVFGTIAAYYVYALSGENWRLCYYIGGTMGFMLLFLRVGVLESTMYDAAKKQSTTMGNFAMFFTNKERFWRYFRSILIGLPVWFVIGVLISFSDEFAKAFHITGFDQPKALMLQYVALTFGDMGAGLMSNYLKSRKKTLLIYYSILSVFIALFFVLKGGGSATNMYLLCMGLGFGSGISVLYITMSAEQFGTNLRATAAISIPNLVRGFLPLIILLFKFLRSASVLNNYVSAAWVTAIIVIITGLVSVLFTKETFNKDLDFVEG